MKHPGHASDGLVCCVQPEDNRSFFTKLLHFCISNWEKALVLGILITLIVLVSVKVTPVDCDNLLASTA